MTVTQAPSIAERVEKFVEALAGVKEFPTGQFSNRLFNKLRRTDFLSDIRDNVAAEENFGPDDGPTKLHNTDVAHLLEGMAAQYVARAIAKIDASHDPFDFRATIDKVGTMPVAAVAPGINCF